MDISFKQLNDVIKAIQYDFNRYSGEQTWESCVVNLELQQEDIQGEKLIDCLILTVVSKVSKDGDREYEIARRVEIFSGRDNQPSRFTKTETKLIGD